jgi:hypothetical protein
LRSAESKRAHVPGNAGIRDLPHAAEHAAAGKLRLIGLRAVHAAVDFAGQRIEGLPGAVDRLIKDSGDERIGDRATVERRRNHCLIPRLRHGRKAEATTAAAAAASASVVVVVDQRQEYIVGVIAESGREKSQVARDTVESGAAQSVRSQDHVLRRRRVSSAGG